MHQAWVQDLWSPQSPCSDISDKNPCREFSEVGKLCIWWNGRKQRAHCSCFKWVKRFFCSSKKGGESGFCSAGGRGATSRISYHNLAKFEVCPKQVVGSSGFIITGEEGGVWALQWFYVWTGHKRPWTNRGKIQQELLLKIICIIVNYFHGTCTPLLQFTIYDVNDRGFTTRNLNKKKSLWFQTEADKSSFSSLANDCRLCRLKWQRHTLPPADFFMFPADLF